MIFLSGTGRFFVQKRRVSIYFFGRGGEAANFSLHSPVGRQGWRTFYGQILEYFFDADWHDPVFRPGDCGVVADEG
jgi:hypothetical protein